MAQEWYLLKTNHDVVSGFESEALLDYGADSFNESLQPPLADEVEICNCDLSIRNRIYAIIKGKTQDTKLNSLNRQILVPIGSCKTGDYVYYKKRYWIIVGLVDDNSVYEKGVMLLCNRILSWVNDKGKVIQRWAAFQSAAQYNNGETSDRYKYVRSDQLLVIMSMDEESLMIKHKQRFIIDKRCDIYEKSFSSDVKVNTEKPLLVYELTRTDNAIFDYQDSGHFEFMAYQDEQHSEDGYYVIDGKGYWLCKEPNDTDNQSQVLLSKIECDEPIIYCGLESTVFTAKFYDENGNEIMVSPQWEVKSDFTDKLKIDYVDSSICISADSEKLINKSFELLLHAFGYEDSLITVTIKDFI